MANEVRLIDANALFPYGAVPFVENDGFATADKLYGIIKNAPTIDPESLRPKGRWEKYWCETDLIGHMYEVCPNCQSCEILDTDKFWDSNYCPNCGAKMEN
jgi:hypothetical protein